MIGVNSKIYVIIKALLKDQNVIYNYALMLKHKIKNK